MNTQHSGTLRSFIQFVVVLIAALILGTVCSASANDIFIAQNAAGAGNGQDCADARSYTFFNSSSNWGGGSGQIGPGTTVHLCGTFTAPAGANGYLSFQTSGANGNPITLKFETNAVLSAPFWGQNGAIMADGQSFIAIDGGSNGVIEATDNGTDRSFRSDGAGIFFQWVSNSEIKNLTISDIYVHTNDVSDENGQNAYGIRWDFGSNIMVDNNTVHDTKWCSYYAYEGGATSSNVNVFSNTLYNCDHGISIGEGNTGATLNTASIHDNIIHDWVNWDDNNNNNHHDGIHTWSVANNDVITGMRVYNNYIYGDGGFGINAWIFMESGQGSNGTDDNSEVFNNVLVDGGTLSHNGCGIICTLNNGTRVYNNVAIGSTTSNNTALNFYGTGVSAKNNIVSHAQTGIAIVRGGSIASGGVDSNDYYQLSPSGAAFEFQGTFYGALSGWQNGCGCDSQAIAANPELNSTYGLQAGSPATAGVNLTSVGISLLDFDKNGAARPSSGNWDMGAFQSGGGGGNPPQPPVGLSVVVN